MLIIRLAPDENGAHANQYVSGELLSVPEGWAAIPGEMESGALDFIPWVSLVIQNGAVTAVSEDIEAKRAFKEKQEDENEFDK